MKLQHKAWALVLAIVGLAALGAMFGARYLVADSFRQLESERATREGERARRLLNQQLIGLSSTVKDYAHWVDAVRFTQGRAPTFMGDNFEVSNLGYLRISEVMVFDTQGRLLSSITLKPDGGLGTVPVDRASQLFGSVAPVVADASGQTTLRTYRAESGRLEMLAAAAIRDPGQSGDVPHGAILMVRHFDEAERQRFSDVLMVPVSLSFDTPDHEKNGSHLVPTDGDRDELHAVVKDNDGRAVVELVLSLERDLQRVGSALAWQGMVLSLVAGLLASVVLVVLLDRWVLRRLQRLLGEVQAITERGPTAAGEVAVEGRDELSRLGEGVNGLLARVRADAQHQHAAHERQEALQIQLMQSQKTEALGRLTGGIAHDFNNSLAAITGWVRLAAEDVDTEHPSQEALQQALKATRYADGLMRQLLAFGRQSAPKLRRLHWSGLIEETRQMVTSGLARECDVSVTYEVDDDEVDADPTQLQQVLVNLLINAADAMQGKGRIELALNALEVPPVQGLPLPPGASVLEPGRYLVLSVRDHGPGIAAEHADRVFEPFFTTKAKGRGTGLGLSVAQGIMARHHGTIGLVSGSDGACFYLYLPASRRDEAVTPTTSPGGPGQGRQLLFVDDDQSVRHAWSALLDRKGWHVTRSRDGEEAWAQFSQTGKHWDVVLTDQSMPRLDGVGLAQRIRATQSPPPVVLMSGHVDEVSPELLKTLFAAVLHKPVDAAELDRVLQGVVQSVDAGTAPT
jgi:two-component system, cell cycle sensor histidine kinase and response regulator CckA